MGVTATGSRSLRGVLIDWGGVLTTSLAESIKAWVEADRIDAEHYRDVMRELVLDAYEYSGAGAPAEGTAVANGNPIHALERGEVDAPAFERDLASRLRTLDGVPPRADGLLARMFADFRPVPAMYDMLRLARSAGVRTCLLSNSWANEYNREGWDEMFDAVVISGEVGMRKPEERIFRYAVDRLGLTPGECVFIDDIEPNIQAARALGIVGLHHQNADLTVAELEALFGIALRRA